MTERIRRALDSGVQMPKLGCVVRARRSSSLTDVLHYVPRGGDSWEGGGGERDAGECLGCD
jgi:hypothetical protein